eukprot:3697891-Amphidinium_carterae.1
MCCKLCHAVLFCAHYMSLTVLVVLFHSVAMFFFLSVSNLVEALEELPVVFELKAQLPTSFLWAPAPGLRQWRLCSRTLLEAAACQ